jgi:hypothetical protein
MAPPSSRRPADLVRLERIARVLAPLLGAVALLVVALHPLFVSGHLPQSYDVDTFYAPTWEFVAHAVRASRLPFWDPTTFGGTTFLGDPQSQALYPPTLFLFRWYSLATATVLWYAFHYLVALGGAYWLASRLRLPPRAAVLAGLAFAGSTYLAARAQAPTLLAGAAWMPVVLAAAARPRAARGRLDLLNLGLAFAFCLQVLAGSQQVLVVTAVAALIVAGGLVSPRAGAWAAASLLLGALLAAPELLSMATIVRDSTASSGIDRSGFGALGWSDRVILSGRFSSTASETAPLYVGIFGLGLAAAGLAAERASRQARVVAALLALALLWSLGVAGKVISVVAPPLATVSAHQPVRALPLAVLGLALGAATWFARPRRPRDLVLVVGVALAGFALAGSFGSVSPWVTVAAALASVLAAAAAVRLPGAVWPVAAFALVLACDLAVHDVNIRNTHQPPAVWQDASARYPAPNAIARKLQQLGVSPSGWRYAWLAPPVIREHQLSRASTPAGRDLLLNGGSRRYSLPTVGGYNPLISASWSRLVAASNQRAIADRHFLYAIRPETPLLRAYAVRYYVCVPSVCPRTLPVVERSGAVEVVRDDAAAPFARIATGGRSTALDATSTTDGAITVHASSTGARGTVTLASRFVPGWHARVDGRMVATRASPLGALQLDVPPGWQTIGLTFTPPGARLGWLLSILALLACAALIVRRYAITRPLPTTS